MTEEQNEAAKVEALAELEQATSAYRRAKSRFEQQQETLHAAIVKAFQAGARPSEIEQRAPYDRNHIGRIRAAAGIPARRPATVQPIERNKSTPKKIAGKEATR